MSDSGHHVARHPAIEAGAIRNLAGPDEAIAPADRDAGFLRTAGIAMSIPGFPGSGRPLANFSVQRASVSFCAAFAG